MIRVVLAVALTVALVGVSAAGIDRAGAVATEESVRGDLAAVERAATSLLETEAVPPGGQPGPRRTVAVALPADSPTTAAVAYVSIERGDTGSVATYRVDGRAERRLRFPVPIVCACEGPLVLEGSGERRLRLTLEREDGDRIVVVERA